MKKTVFVGAVLFSGALAVINNVLNGHSVAWVGSPEVLPKPEGWPTLTVAQGLQAGVKVALKDFRAHQGAILAGLAIVLVAMVYLNRSRRAGVGPMLRTVLRLGLGCMFLIAAYPKFSDPKGFADLVAQYQLLPAFAVDAFSIWLPAFEITVGLGLIFTLWEQEFALLVGALLLMFIVALGQALLRNLGIACGCFDIEGATDAGESWFSLVRDLVLLLPVAWMILTGGRRYIHWGRNR
jgi:cobalamin synthase